MYYRVVLGHVIFHIINNSIYKGSGAFAWNSFADPYVDDTYNVGYRNGSAELSMACVSFKNQSGILYCTKLQRCYVFGKVVLGKASLVIIFLDISISDFYDRSTCFSETQTSFCGCFIMDDSVMSK